LEQAIKVSAEAMEMTRQALRPGRTGEEIEAVARKHVKEGGLGDYYTYDSIHSVGTAEAEEPILGPGCKLVVQPGMVFNIDVPLFLAPFGGFRHEDGFLLTDGGNERLNKTPLGPFVV
jgi:Xaa-Pro aminopeptidase